ncbi:uncharacterized protein BYT42DRAFT_500545 [Radiomyces spectabilis]|uniref:uncharacterized protein n=1 Tax=Radiomyces spectabilis TaxID=64574 RepID=UPI002220F5F9|nr:uncharacterized protein BYT42DRAFT_500545 [Radiomyces spectabilis]KAI8372728.1 hypothetical protein BYT42DRAFT_500545 [Radiomyces spectabilis]
MRRRPRFAPFLSPDEIEKQIKKDALYRGILRINKRNRSDAYVTCENLEGDIYIHRERDRNRALEGDLVAVRLLDVDKVWKSKVERDRKKKEEKDGISAIQLEEEDKTKSKYCGQVVGIISRAESQTVAGNGGSNGKEEKPEEDVEEQDDEEPVDDEVDGKQVNNGNERSHENIRLAWFKPTDKRTPLVAIPIRHVPADFLENQEKYNSLILLAKITRWPIDSQHPFGKIERELGPVGNVKVETEAILADNNIKEVPFTDKALKGLPETPWKIPQGEYQKRRDLREYRIFTIDPATARDLDDALHIKPLENGQFEVGVHIADVSHFVRDHTPLDTEARSRGTSTYLVDRVIPMLPSLLCEELCSLNPGVERLAFSVIWKMDGEGNVLETWFGKSIIKSCAKLAYSDAQSVIEGGELPITATVQNHEVNAVKKDILHLYQLSKHMRKRRFDNGALSIGSVRLSFTLDDDNEPDSVNIYETKEANHLIEEFMLRANMSVAEKICQQYPSEALLRRHAPPIERRLEEFLRQTEELGYPFEGHSAGALQASFDSVESEDVKAVLRILAIKPMQRAKYFCTGSIDIAKYLHFALNVPLYTHFTSPIRRYADVMVHRQLQAALLNKEHCGYTMKTVQSVALQCNRKKDGAKNAQDQHIQLYLSRFLYRLQETQGPIVRSAIVLLVAKDAFEIFVPEYALEKRIYTDSLPLEREAFNATDMSLSIYWKEGAVLNRETADQIRRENDGKKSESDDSDREANGADDYVEEAEDDAEGPLSGKTALKIPDNMLEENRLDDKTRMQYLKAFTRLDVLIQVDMDRSPPVVHIYPVNPFLKK